MDTAIVVALLCIGAVAGGLIVAAWYSDWAPPVRDIHSGTDDVEKRSRRAF
jgi:hypothetical protein